MNMKYTTWIALLGFSAVLAGLFLPGCPGAGIAPVAEFSAEPRSGAAPLAVAFTDLSVAGTEEIRHYTWEFGDSSLSVEANPSHTYETPGTYAVTLLVYTEDTMAMEKKSGYIVVSGDGSEGEREGEVGVEGEGEAVAEGEGEQEGELPLVGIIISEFMADNATAMEDEDGDSPDWIELYNGGAEAVNMLGWSLTDDDADPVKWVFPEYVFPAGAYLVVFASGKDRSAASDDPWHTNFKLSAGGEFLGLYDNSRTPRTVFDPAYPVLRPDAAYGYDFQSDAYTDMQTPTPGEANAPPVAR
jgi:PKD repeat protein